MNIIIFLLSLIPIFVILYFVYSLDKIEQEPKKMLIVLFVGGMLSLILIKILANALYNFDPEILYGEHSSIQQFFEKFSLVGVVEEFSKWIIVYLLIWKNKQFNYVYDGVVYAVFVSMGFATIENFNYMFEYGNITTLISRSLLTVPAHACFGIVMGTYLGDAKYYRDSRKGFYKFKAFVIPMVLHGLYDFLLSFNRNIFIIFLIYFIILLIISITKIFKYANNNNAKLFERNDFYEEKNGINNCNNSGTNY